MQWVLSPYARYLLVGGLVGLLCVVLREAIGAMLPRDTPLYYGSSVVIVYAIGIAVSFTLHRLITFRIPSSEARFRKLFRFSLISIASAGCTGIVAVVVRYAPGFERVFAPHGAMAAFIFAAVLISVFSYRLNAMYVFPPVGIARHK